MKILPKLLGVTILALAFPATAGISVDRIDPPHWWTGMKNHSLQLQIHGEGIRPAEFSVSYPGVSIDSVVRLDGTPNWQYVYLNISPEAKPGKMKLEWHEGKKKVSREYELRARRHKGAQGFSSADVMYLMMPDRFSDGNPANNAPKELRNRPATDRSDPNVRHGGDFAGIMQHIPYLDSLGITALWVNPVLENDMAEGSYHGYNTTDYYRVDPRFGSNAEYAQLVDSLHSHGIKTVMDMIFNHCGIEHPWFNDRPAKDWFNFADGYVQTNYRLNTISDPYASDYDKRLTLEGWFVEGMPDLNQDNPHLLNYLIQNSIWWVEEAGIDGIRQDTYPYIKNEHMAEWVKRVMAEYPQFNIVGECWYADAAGVSNWQKGSPLPGKKVDTELPTVMDFPLMIKVRDMKPFREQTDAQHGLNTLYEHLSLDFIYPDPHHLLRFLDNHDTERFIQNVPDSLDQWKQGVAFLLTVPGIPQLYYGTELLMSGTRAGGDGNIRKDMPGGFPGDKENQFERSGRSEAQNEAFDFISRINKWRKGNKAVAEGRMKHFLPDNGLYVYERNAGDANRVIVVMNGRDEYLNIDMSRYAEIAGKGEQFRDVLTGATTTLVPTEGKRNFRPREILILEPIK